MLRTPVKPFVKPCQTQFVRYKRTKSAATPATQRVVTQLSVLSGKKKIPKMLNLCNEDIVRHQTVSNAWSLVQKQKREAHEKKLAQQYAAMDAAVNDLKETDEKLYKSSVFYEKGKRYSLELRAPTEYPPREVWNYGYVKDEEK